MPSDKKTKAVRGHDEKIPAKLWQPANSDTPAPRLLDVLSQCAHFFDQLGYTKTLTALLDEAKNNGFRVNVSEWDRGCREEHAAPLLELWEEWYRLNDGFPVVPGDEQVMEEAKAEKKEKKSKKSKKEESSSDSSSSSESESDSDSDSTSDDSSDASSDSDSSGSDSEAEKAKPGQKRKRAATPSLTEDESSDSDSDSDSDSSSDESDARPTKRTKVQSKAKDDDSSDASSSSDSDSDDEDKAGGVDVNMKDADSSSASSDSDSDSSDSSSSDSESSSSSDSESSSSPPPKKQKASKKVKEESTGSAASSATLDNESDPAPPKKFKKEKKAETKPAETQDEILAPVAEVEGEPNTSGIHPDRLRQMPASNETIKQLKKQNVPFSRIPADTKVDPRFSSNDYVPYDYANRAYQDLIVTKGKGFTKEKNKKKRGSYRGGAIDLAPKGIKFED
ncbi:hypothetical protein KC315_g948 [Hortaea werneckii]|nr:hypothetical protein KC315_g948 [Hortaea werneckii]